MTGGWRGPLLGAAAAAAAAIPALAVPYLADDWVNLAATREEVPLRTPFSYFRPLYMASFFLEQRLFGPAPAVSHLTNLALASIAAALVVLLARRYTGDGALAAGAGVLFALHPFHVENVAWAAARADLMAGALALAAALSYERWRAGCRGVPVASLLLLEAALLSKESAVVLPPFLLALALLDRSRRPTRAEWARGHLALAAVVLAHFVLLRPAALGEPGMRLLGNAGIRWLWNLLAFGAAAILPAHSETLETSPALWGTLALLSAAALVLLARRRHGKIPGAAILAAISFVVLLLPSLISFQERYLFLPSAASALALVSLLSGAGRRIGLSLAVVLAAGWVAALAGRWQGVLEAAAASETLVGRLVEISREPGVREILIANMPYRVGGAAVVGDLSSAVALSGGREVAVVPVAAVDYPSAGDDALAGSSGDSIRPGAGHVEVTLRVREGRFSRLALPLRPPRFAPSVPWPGTDVRIEPDGLIRVLIERAPERGRAICVWVDGDLRTLP